MLGHDGGSTISPVVQRECKTTEKRSVRERTNRQRG
jgi:hypothetical protein